MSRDQKYVLGIDLGTNSVGWAALRLDETGRPVGLLESGEAPSLGARIFTETVENLGGGDREQPKNANRRQKRLLRRQTERRVRRQRKTFQTLVAAGLLPEPSADANGVRRADSAGRDEVLRALDEQLRATWATGEYSALLAKDPGRLPYVLRKAGLDVPLEPRAFGRALYHLAQRRGFLSNRKADKKQKKDEDQGQVKKDISDLRATLAAGGATTRTLGEFLCSLDRDDRIRRRWTARDMYEAEFEALWEAQVRHTPSLAGQRATVFEYRTKRVDGKKVVVQVGHEVPLKQALHRALFFQRPLKSATGLIGACELENGREYVDPETGEVHTTKRRRRAPICSPLFQEFRLLQKVNDLRVRVADAPERALCADERVKLVHALVTLGDLPFNTPTRGQHKGAPSVKSVLGFDTRAQKTVTFNLEREDEVKLVGHRTNETLRSVFGERWERLPSETQERLVLELWSIEQSAAVERRVAARKGGWALLEPSDDEAKAIAAEGLEPDYCAYSRHALLKLLPLMREGKALTTARMQVYGELQLPALDRLPRVDRLTGDLKNPVVSRALTELRHVVNAIVARWGKPERIHVELARDLKRSKKQRFDLQKRNKEQERRRDTARKAIEGHLGRNAPIRRDDIERYLLWEESGRQCPYTGRSVGLQQLFDGSVEVEHIIPFARSLDNSWNNKTICFRETNRDKAKRTPFEAFGEGDAESWAGSEIIQRVKRMVNDGMSPVKLERFLRTDPPETQEAAFRSQQLNDTRHASLLARRFLMQLYGGVLERGADANGRTRVQVGNGSVTADVRRVFDLNPLLSSSDRKSRDDHRHHAIDAVAIALTDPALMHALSAAAAKPEAEKRKEGGTRVFGRLQNAWADARADLEKALDHVVTSHRVKLRTRGSFHAETNFGLPRDDDGRRLELTEHGWRTAAKQPVTGSVVAHVRKGVTGLSANDVEKIVDPAVRAAVEAALAASGQSDPAKAFTNDRWPTLRAKDGRLIPIRKVRVARTVSLLELGKGDRRRFAETETNHHMAIFEVPTKKGPKWEFVTVPLLEAARRLQAQRRRFTELTRSGVGEAEARSRSQAECPIVVRSLAGEPQARFVMALCPGELVEIDTPYERRGIYCVRGVNKSGRPQLVQLNDARLKKEIIKDKQFLEPVVESLRKLRPLKVTVDRLGRVKGGWRDAPST